MITTAFGGEGDNFREEELRALIDDAMRPVEREIRDRRIGFTALYKDVFGLTPADEFGDSKPARWSHINLN